MEKLARPRHSADGVNADSFRLGLAQGKEVSPNLQFHRIAEWRVAHDNAFCADGQAHFQQALLHIVRQRVACDFQAATHGLAGECFSGGFDFKVSQKFGVSASYLFIRSEENKVENSQENYTAGISPFNGTYNSTANLFSLSLYYNF